MSLEPCKHGRRICSQCVVISDAAKRISDRINLHLTFTPFDQLANGWMAFALADGDTDGTVYPSKSDAIRHQRNEFLYMYIAFRNLLGGASPKDCQLLLDFHRHAYDNNMRMAEPEAPQLIMPLARGIGRWPN